MKKIRLVCGTRASEEDFIHSTALGKSLMLYCELDFLELKLYPNNSQPLSVIYNQAIESSKDDPAILVFIHDDVHLCDFHWHEQLRLALQQFDIVGLAGNKRRQRLQASWLFVTAPDGQLMRDAPEHLSGAVGHGAGFPCEDISVFGPSRQQCKLLDGLMLCVRSETLIKKGLRFDPQFAFHFYDMDFCRQAELKKLRMGAWPISVVHESVGAYETQGWQDAYALYLKKYKE